MAAPQIDLTAGLVPKSPPPGQGIDLSAGFVPKAVAQPSAAAETGAWAGLKRAGSSILHAPGAILDAITKPPQNADEEQMQNLGGSGALAVHRLIAEPMKQQRETAKQYQQQATGSTETPEAKAGFDFSLTGETPQEKAQHLANLHNIASVVPVLGPMVSDLTERFLGIGAHEGKPDKSGALAEGATYIAAPKAAEEVAKAAPVAASAAVKAIPEAVKNYTPSGDIPGLIKRTVAGQTVGRLPGASLVELAGSKALTRPTLAEWVQALKPDAQMSLFKNMPKLGDTPISPATHPATIATLAGASGSIDARLAQLNDTLAKRGGELVKPEDIYGPTQRTQKYMKAANGDPAKAAILQQQDENLAAVLQQQIEQSQAKQQMLRK